MLLNKKVDFLFYMKYELGNKILITNYIHKFERNLKQVSDFH